MLTVDSYSTNLYCTFHSICKEEQTDTDKMRRGGGEKLQTIQLIVLHQVLGFSVLRKSFS